jgi:hypothetical protein
LLTHWKWNNNPIVVNDNYASLINPAKKISETRLKEKVTTMVARVIPSIGPIVIANRTNHIVEFCYAKHGYHNPNKSKQGGESSNMVNTEVANSACTNSKISQDKYDQIVTLLHQANLTPPASTNQIFVPLAHSHSLIEPSSCNACTISCSLHANSIH